MVELNNKLQLPNYTRFENKFLNTFKVDSVITFDTNILSHSNVEKFDTSLDMSIDQVKNHLQNVSSFNIFEITDNYDNIITLNFMGKDKFSSHNVVNIKSNTNNIVYINYDIDSEISTNGLEIFAKENSVTDVIINIKGNGKNSNFIKANVERDATLNIYYINSFQDDLNDLSVALLGENASSKVKTVAIAKNAKKFFSVRIDHFAKNSFGRIVNHGVGLEDSRLIINGFGKIHKSCNGSDNYQKSKIMTLSDSARVEANPILLIDEYDVVASHAASVSNVDENQLYYLMSRGINNELGKVLLIKGFLKSIINEIENNEIKEEFEKTLDNIIGYTDGY